MTLHVVEDVGQAHVVLAYRCHTCASAVSVEFPTTAHHAAIRSWLNRHPSGLAGARAVGAPAPGPERARPAGDNASGSGAPGEDAR